MSTRNWTLSNDSFELNLLKRHQATHSIVAKVPESLEMLYITTKCSKDEKKHLGITFTCKHLCRTNNNAPGLISRYKMFSSFLHPFVFRCARFSSSGNRPTSVPAELNSCGTLTTSANVFVLYDG